MKKLVLCLLGIGLIASAGFAGVGYSGKEVKQVAVPPPCPEWYADNEFNVSLWGTYVFTGTEWINDRYMLSDTPGAVVSTPNTFSIATSALGLKAGSSIPIRRGKMSSST
jgi:hypothetical protein